MKVLLELRKHYDSIDFPKELTNIKKVNFDGSQIVFFKSKDGESSGEYTTASVALNWLKSLSIEESGKE